MTSCFGCFISGRKDRQQQAAAAALKELEDIQGKTRKGEVSSLILPAKSSQYKPRGQGESPPGADSSAQTICVNKDSDVLPISVEDTEVFVEVTSAKTGTNQRLTDRQSDGSKQATIARPLTAAQTPRTDRSEEAGPVTSPAPSTSPPPGAQPPSSQPSPSSSQHLTAHTEAPQSAALPAIPESPTQSAGKPRSPVLPPPAAAAAGAQASSASSPASSGAAPSATGCTPRHHSTAEAATEVGDEAATEPLLSASLSVWRTPVPPPRASSSAGGGSPAQPDARRSPGPPAPALNPTATSPTSAVPNSDLAGPPRAAAPGAVAPEQPTQALVLSPRPDRSAGLPTQISFAQGAAATPGFASIVPDRVAAFLLHEADDWAAVAASPAASKEVAAAAEAAAMAAQPGYPPSGPAAISAAATSNGTVEPGAGSGCGANCACKACATVIRPCALPGLRQVTCVPAAAAAPASSSASASAAASSGSACTGAASETCGSSVVGPQASACASSSAPDSVAATPTSAATLAAAGGRLRPSGGGGVSSGGGGGFSSGGGALVPSGGDCQAASQPWRQQGQSPSPCAAAALHPSARVGDAATPPAPVSASSSGGGSGSGAASAVRPGGRAGPPNGSAPASAWKPAVATPLGGFGAGGGALSPRRNGGGPRLTPVSAGGASRQSPAGSAYAGGYGSASRGGARFVPIYAIHGGASVGPMYGGRQTPPPYGAYSSASTRLALHDVLSRRGTRSRGGTGGGGAGGGGSRAGGGGSVSVGAGQLVDVDFRPRWRY